MIQEVEPGQIIESRYVVEASLASGGQADVYRARHAELDRVVAIKLLRNHGSPEVQSRMTRRFEQEARLISRLKDPHTITLYDFGRLPTGSLFMVFEYVDGLDLKQLIATQGAITPYRVAKILRQTLSSLHEAHSMGVLHRDLKPANIMLFEHAGRQDQVKLLDFGIAKILREEGEPVVKNKTDVLVGTPRYMAPELLLNEPPSPASDLYSLGLVGYELLVGQPAIRALSSLEVIGKQIAKEDIKLPEALDFPRDLRQIIDRMMCKDLAKRYSDSEQVIRDLKRWMQRSLPEGELHDEPMPELPAPVVAEAQVIKPVARKPIPKINVITPSSLEAPELTPREAFARSVVFKGKPSARQVDALLHDSVRAHTPHVLPAIERHAIEPPRPASDGSYEAIVAHPLPYSRERSRSKRRPPMLALVVILGLTLLIGLIGASLLVLYMS